MFKALLLIIIGLPAYAGFFDEHAQGYWWYNTSSIENNLRKKDPQTGPAAIAGKVLAIKKELKYKKERALLYPTDENVKSFIALQNKIYN